MIRNKKYMVIKTVELCTETLRSWGMKGRIESGHENKISIVGGFGLTEYDTNRLASF